MSEKEQSVAQRRAKRFQESYFINLEKDTEVFHPEVKEAICYAIQYAYAEGYEEGYEDGRIAWKELRD